MASNPFEATYTKLWAIVEDDAKLTARFKPGNRVKWNQRRAKKDRLQSADVPQLEIFPKGLTDINLFATTHTSFMTMNFDFVVFSGTDNAAQQVWPAQFELMQAIARYSKTYGLELGLDFVRQIKWSSAPVAIIDTESPTGFDTIMQVAVQLQLNSADQLIADSPSFA